MHLSDAISGVWGRIDSSIPRAFRGGLWASGVGWVWALAFEHPGWPIAGWLAPGLLLAVSGGSTPGVAFRAGYVAGLIHHLVALRWLLWIPFPAGAVAGWLALSAFLALYPAVWCWACHRACFRWRGGEVAGGTVLAGLYCAVSWTGLEMVRGWFLTGFPWNFLGVSQWRMLPLIQVASVTGVYGVSFIVAWFSVSMLAAVRVVVRDPTRRWGWQREMALPLVALALLAAWGTRRVASGARIEAGARPLNLALVQPSIPQQVIWDPAEQPVRFRQLMELSERAVASGPDVLVWPEAAMPSLRLEHFQAMTNLAVRAGVWMVFGADDVESAGTAEDPERVRIFNSAFLFDRQGGYVASYRKQRLVMFGEYVPWARWLPFLKRLTPIEGGFASGDGPTLFEMQEPAARTSVLICFEDVFPGLVRRHAALGVDFLLNLTNDGWFGETGAQWQHAASAAFRAVENGVPLVRCTNNGLTCWVDGVGRLRSVGINHANPVYGPGHVLVQVPIGATVETFYRRTGDWFGWSCVGLTVLGCLRGPGRLFQPR